MATNKVREKVTSSADVMRCRVDVMGAREAPCLGAPFGEVPWRQQGGGGFVSAVVVRLARPAPQVAQTRYMSSSMWTFALLRDSSDLHIYKDLYGERS